MAQMRCGLCDAINSIIDECYAGRQIKKPNIGKRDAREVDEYEVVSAGGSNSAKRS